MIQVIPYRTIDEDFSLFGLSFEYDPQISLILRDEEPIKMIDNSRKGRRLADKVQDFLGLTPCSESSPHPLTNKEIVEIFHLMKHGGRIGREFTFDKFQAKYEQNPGDILACQIYAISLFAKGEEVQARKVLEKTQALYEAKGRSEKVAHIKNTVVQVKLINSK